ILFCFSIDTVSRETYTLSHTTLFRSRLALFIASDGVRHQGKIGALVIGNVLHQVIGFHVVRNDELTAPTRVATREVGFTVTIGRSEEHTSELQSRENLVCRLLLEKKK